jgi:hypothetical protein
LQIIAHASFSVVAAIIVCALENYDEPFKAPSILNIRPKVTCRVSYFDGILERSASRRSIFDHGGEIRREESFLQIPIDEKPIKRKPVPPSPRTGTQTSSSASTLVESPSQSGRPTGDLIWMALVKEKSYDAECRSQAIYGRRVSTSGYQEKDGKPGLKYSHLSLSAETSPSSAFTACLQDKTSSEGEMRRAAPGSGISSSSQRSPLSTMRYVSP